MDLKELLPMIFEFLKNQNFDLSGFKNILNPPNQQVLQTQNLSNSAFQLPNYNQPIQTEPKQPENLQQPNLLNSLSPEMLEKIVEMLSSLFSKTETKKEDEPSFFSNLTRCDD